MTHFVRRKIQTLTHRSHWRIEIMNTRHIQNNTDYQVAAPDLKWNMMQNEAKEAQRRRSR
ncbi:hypothetical protein CIHG_02060 [Coccidioides immitis H538.4]|uniref:Uncharacterized protein n=2 Tax=Coccidioides immitis TaxID=5501 RepID=A0A0J8RK11_COCIT|nr:hypothetical protein CIRG_00238 [Coccidioides immitis RMSCC 2394]KMU84274.1 hypothetical protein CIHG_02060 [Coccidioides immitis H538.4]